MLKGRPIIRLKGFFDKKGESAVLVDIKKMYLRKDGVNKWFCHVELEPIRDIGHKALFMRFSKRIHLIFKKGYFITIDVDEYNLEDSIIMFKGYLNKKHTVWRHIIFDRVRVNRNVENDNSGDINEEKDNEYDEIHI